MTLPTKTEIEKAFEEAAMDGPLPLAGCCDLSLNLRLWIDRVCRATGLDEQLVKTGLVMGLNIGIRIGEERTRA